MMEQRVEAVMVALWAESRSFHPAAVFLKTAWLLGAAGTTQRSAEPKRCVWFSRGALLSPGSEHGSPR